MSSPSWDRLVDQQRKKRGWKGLKWLLVALGALVALVLIGTVARGHNPQDLELSVLPLATVPAGACVTADAPVILAKDTGSHHCCVATVWTLCDPPGGGGSPGGADKQVQFNDGGAFGGDADLTWDKTLNQLDIAGDLTQTAGELQVHDCTKTPTGSGPATLDPGGCTHVEVTTFVPTIGIISGCGGAADAGRLIVLWCDGFNDFHLEDAGALGGGRNIRLDGADTFNCGTGGEGHAIPLVCTENLGGIEGPGWIEVGARSAGAIDADIATHAALPSVHHVQTGATDTTLTKTGDNLGINLANANTWTGQHQFDSLFTVVKTLINDVDVILPLQIYSQTDDDPFPIVKPSFEFIRIGQNTGNLAEWESAAGVEQMELTQAGFLRVQGVGDFGSTSWLIDVVGNGTFADLTIDDLFTFTETAGDPTCAAGDYGMKGNSSTGKLRACENGTLFDLNTPGGAHDIDGADHTASGLTIGHHLRATGATTFAFGAVLDADLPSTIARDSELPVAGTGLEDIGPGTFNTLSTEAGFLDDGGASSLTCGASNFGKLQVMDDGDLEWCDGAATPALQSVDAKITTHAGLPNSHHAQAHTFGGADHTADTSANLATRITDETGTGLAVFSANPALTGNPTAPTAAANDNDTSISSTAFVQQEINGAGGEGLTCASGTCDIAKRVACWTLFDPGGLADTDDIPSIWKAPAAVTVTEIWCETDAGSPTINPQRDDGTAANMCTASLTCTTGGATCTLAAAEDNLADGDRIDHVTISASTADRVNVCVEYTVD